MLPLFFTSGRSLFRPGHTALGTFLLLLALSQGGLAQGADSASTLSRPPQELIPGQWRFNEDLSDSTDRQVEAALRAAGQRVQRRGLFNNDKERYRGGPEEQEMYDRISYDRALQIEQNGEHYRFRYQDGFTRTIYMDNRERTVSLSNLGEVQDFSLGHWEGTQLVVEGRPRDGGFTEEVYRLMNDGRQLEAKLYIHPRTFQEPIEVRRVYDRAAGTETR